MSEIKFLQDRSNIETTMHCYELPIHWTGSQENENSFFHRFVLSELIKESQSEIIQSVSG